MQTGTTNRSTVKNDPPVIIVYGPTGVGKTAFVDELAHQLPIEIINMDMGQQYVPLTIGTAKPEWKTSPIPHHLFDTFNTPENGTVITYREAVVKTVKDIYARSKTPVLVGGSGFYLKSLLFPPKAPIFPESFSAGSDGWSRLVEIDPERAAKIHPSDTYRISRALSLWGQTGKKPSTFKPGYEPPFNYLLICLTRNRDELYRRIDGRVKEMLQMGWQQEAKALLGTDWEPFVKKKNILGYSALFYLHNKILSEKEVIGKIQQETRNYAKRQMTFWRMVERLIDAAATTSAENGISCCYKGIVNLTEVPVDHYIGHLLGIVRDLKV